MKTEVVTANLANRQQAYDRYIKLFDHGVRAHGLVPGQPASLLEIKEHYNAVFFDLKDGYLVEDGRVVAGPMAAHRYHSMTTLNGKFDGVEAVDMPVVIRGQTFFKYNRDGKIVERWSNHDHAYRMAQLLGEAGRTDGAKLAKVLNGPGLDEKAGYDFVERFVEVFSMADAPEERESSFIELLKKDLVVHGLGCGERGKAEFIAYFDEKWTYAPDLFMTLIDRPISGWSMVAFKWRANGSARTDQNGSISARRSAVSWDGQMIVRLDSVGKASEIWINANDIAPEPKTAHKL